MGSSKRRQGGYGGTHIDVALVFVLPCKSMAVLGQDEEDHALHSTLTSLQNTMISNMTDTTPDEISSGVINTNCDRES